MDLATVPGLLTALRARGYRVRGPAGVGAGGAAWTADAPDGQRVVVAAPELGGTVADRKSAHARLEALRNVEHPHLVPLLDVIELDSGRTALVTAAVAGPTVGAVLEARGGMRPGEVVTLVVPLAEALGALHAAGLAHGDVAPENVVLAPGGRPVLVDLGGVVTPGRGTPGFAPPRTRGDRADDVFALARLGLAALGDEAGAPAGGAARAGSPEAELRRALETVCRADRSARPSAHELAATCFDVVAPEAIAVPEADVLTRLALTRLGDTAMVVRTVRDPVAARRRRVRTATLLGVAATVSVALVLGLDVLRPADLPVEPGLSGSDLATDEARGSGVELEAAGEVREDVVVAAAVTLTERRAEVISRGALERLGEVAVPGSPAFAADEALLARLAGRGAATHVRVEVVEARRLTPDGERELVLVTAAHHAAGDQVTSEPRSVVLALVATPDGWRVEEVLDPADERAASGRVSVRPGPLAG